MQDPASPPPPRASAYWRRTVRLTVLLLALWALVTFGTVWFARELSFTLFGWPLSFWLAAQGVLLVYLGLVGWYARAMRKLEEAEGVAEE